MTRSYLTVRSGCRSVFLKTIIMSIWNDNTLEFSWQEMSALLYVFENASFFFLASHLPLCHSFISQPPSLLSTLFLLPFFLRKTAVMLLDDSTHSWRAYSDPGTYEGLTSIQILTAGRTHTQYIQICLGGRNWLSGFRKDFVLFPLLVFLHPFVPLFLSPCFSLDWYEGQLIYWPVTWHPQ